jgi:light-regulated signal transduction histidine kinase (bacteriophytochrome)
VGGSEIGRGIVCNDVTELERQRRELERQNAQLRELAEAINHELRNSLNLVEGYARRIEEQLDGTDRARVDQSVGRITRATRRMTEVVEDLATLARHGQTVEERTVCQLQDIVEEAWVRTETPGLDLIEPEEATIRADRPRLIQLFVTLFEFSDRNDASVVRISVTPDGFVYAADGRPHVDVDPERLFSFADAAPSAEFGMLLPKVRLLVEVHGWTVELNREQRDGIEFVVSGVTRTPSDGE